MLMTPPKKEFYSRKSPRAGFYHYNEGDYFVTICTQDKAHYFGYIKNGEMHLSDLGRHCQLQLEEVSLHYPYASVLLFIVMPNHIHAIIRIQFPEEDTASALSQRSALGIVVGGLKREVKLFAKHNCFRFDWQHRFHDHIIRGAEDGNRIADYIRTNVERWESDCFYQG